MVTKRHSNPLTKTLPPLRVKSIVRQNQLNSILCFHLFTQVHLHKQEQTHINNVSNLIHYIWQVFVRSSDLSGVRLRTQGSNLFLHLLNQLRQFLLTLLLAVGVDVPGHTFPVDLGRILSLPELVSDP